MIGLSEDAFLIPKNITLLESGPYIIDINKNYIISKENELKLEYAITHSILFSDEIKKQTAACIKGLMAVLDLFKIHNIFVDGVNLNKDIKWSDYKTAAMVENMFKYIIDSISAVSFTIDSATDFTPNINLKCTIARIFYNKRKMLFFILLLIIGVENYEKIGYTFKTGGGGDNCNNFANKLYKLMHEFFFDSMPSKHPNYVKKLPIRRKGSIKCGRGRPSNKSKVVKSSNKRKVNDDEYIPVKKNCINATTTTRKTRSGGQSCCIDNITEIFKYDSEIFHYSLLQNGKDLIVPYNIFEL